MQNLIPSAFIDAAQSAHASPSVRINKRLGDRWEPGPGEKFLSDLSHLLVVVSKTLGNSPFALRLYQRKEIASIAFSAATITQFTDGHLRLFDIDLSLGVFMTHKMGIPDSDTSAMYLLQEASSEAPILYYLSKGCARLFAGKSLVYEFNPATGGPVGTTHHTVRAASEYETMVQEHYEEWVKHNQRTKHWKDTNTRILWSKTSGARKTEEIFQISLWQWLNERFSDRAQARIELRSEADDRTDIEIFPLFGGYFVIEVKWMGKNEKSPPYKTERIDAGLRQITAYINRGASVRRATLVIYDGRAESEFLEINPSQDIAEGVKRLTENIPERGSAFVLYLFSKHASQT